MTVEANAQIYGEEKDPKPWEHNLKKFTESNEE